MAVEIIIPRLGWSMEEGTFGDWLKKAGEEVHAGEPLFSLESDKVTMDIESLDAGILYLPADAPQPGAVVKVGQLIGYLLIKGEEPPRDVPVTPRARRVAGELGIELSQLSGSGKGGRIREEDVRAAVKVADKKQQLPVTALRRAVAERMTQSRQQTAPVTLMRRVDASRLTSLRNRWKLRLQPQPAPSFNDFVTKMVAMALSEHPALGGRWDGDRIVLPDAIHIGIAVDTEQGLLVPVIRDVPNLSLLELSHRSLTLIDSVRRREIQASDMQGGIFTISNLGSFGVEAFTPIINSPETAVLGLGAIRWEPVVLSNGQIVAREQMMLSLTFDHRVVDGAPAARFLQTLAALIEEPPAALHCP
ncbi:MAG TPA: dihydrolipoamide acetyltransferase family protein [Bryobacteraceae bacterium]|nr:dihydrolipoamide acetyltransferase family protein [Bryobacteraceae bacterium]